jgi:hypothetical protein
LILRFKPSDGRHFGHARNSSQVVADVPILHSAQLPGVVITGRIGEDILEYPAESVRVWTEFGFDTRRQALDDAGEMFLDLCSGPVRICAVLKDHVYPGVAVVRDTAYGFDSRQTHHACHERVGDLIFYDGGATIPARKYDYLTISCVGQCVVWQVTNGPDAENCRSQHNADDDSPMAAR